MSTRRPRRAVASMLATGATLAVLTGCSGDSDGRRGSDSAGQAGQNGGQAGRTIVVPGKRVGLLSPKRHEEVAARVSRVVDGWWDAAFVDADYPRTRYQNSFPGFTRLAAAQAWRQRDLTTSARLGKRIDALIPLRRRVAVDVLARRQVPRAATARVRLDYRTTGEVRKRMRVHGRLLLTFDRGWKVFGFDLTQGPWETKERERGEKTRTTARKAGKGNER